MVHAHVHSLFIRTGIRKKAVDEEKENYFSPLLILEPSHFFYLIVMMVTEKPLARHVRSLME